MFWEFRWEKERLRNWLTKLASIRIRNKIVQWCKDWGLPEPAYEEAGGSFVTVFYNPKPEEMQGEKIKVGEKLSSNQQKILELISKDPMISAKLLAKMVGISQRKN